jgi:hypothetical protein
MTEDRTQAHSTLEIWSKVLVNVSKAATFLAIAYAVIQIGMYAPFAAKFFDEQTALSRLQLTQIQQIVSQTERLSATINDASLIYSARVAATEKIIPNRNADEIVDAATDRLAKQYGKEWEVLIRGFVAKLDTLSLN